MPTSRISPKRPTSSLCTFDWSTIRDRDNLPGIHSFIMNNIKQADGTPTNAYGEIVFGSDSTNTAKYIKVSHTMNVSVIYELMTKQWNLKTPNLIISVTGGARNVSLHPRLNEVFQRGLIKASETTGAWITTRGTRAGVFKLVGKAVQQYASVKEDEKRVVTIGVVPWGVIHKRNLLKNHDLANQSSPTIYDLEEGQRTEGVLLDHNHSHFILVDNGMETGKSNISEIYGSEIDFRTELEKFICCQQTSDHVNVMAVCVIVQGGSSSLKTVEGSIRRNTPVVIVEGSGGWADVLANAYNMERRDMNTTVLRDLLTDADAVINEEKLDDWVEMIMTCLSNKHLLTVFSSNRTDLSPGLDIAILEALLKANRYDGTQSHQQLKLAVAWNRSDIAQSHILTGDVGIENQFIAQSFYGALRANKHEFCKVLLDYGIELKGHFAVEDLKSLYESAPKHSVFYKKLAKRPLSLEAVGKLLLKYLGKNYANIYEKRSPESKKYCAIVKQDASEKQAEGDWCPRCELDDPYREIFQWAILFNYREIAKHIWENMFGATQAAIMASRMLKVLASQMGYDREKKLQIKADADEYEMLATGIFADCFVQNPSKSFSLLIAQLPKWGGYTCLHVAMEAGDMHFVSSHGVQSFLDHFWTSRLSQNHFLHLIVAGLLVFPIFVNVTFQAKENDEKNRGGSIEEDGRAIKLANNVESQPVQKKIDEENEVGTPSLNFSEPDDYAIIEKICIFYKAPVVKFLLNIVFFLLYLVLFAFVILSDFKLSEVIVSVWEYILLMWTTTFLLEEVREMVSQEARFLRGKLRLHIIQFWNAMDLSSFALFYIGFGLRYDSSYLEVTLLLYSLTFMIQCVRILHIFAVHPFLGPKLSMVGKMMKDLVFFIFLFIIFLIAYGVVTQALLYPEEKDFFTILVGIVYRPTWQIFGELFLEEINYNPNLSAFECNKDGTDANLPRCPRVSRAIPIISAVYMVLSTVLFLNLLIAMFSCTFNKVESQNKGIWTIQRYRLITDYYFRPPFVPPFIIFSHLYHIVLYIYRKCSKGMKLDDPFRHTLMINLDDEDWRVLRRWEHWYARHSVRQKRKKEIEVDRQELKLSQCISTTMEDNRDRVRKPFTNREFNKVISQRVSGLEELLGGTPPKIIPRTAVHVKARCSMYPSSEVKKVVVPVDKVSWKVEWEEYNPPSFTHPDVAENPPWADKDLEKLDVHLRPKLPFNKFDQNEKVLRKSHIRSYLVEDGIPKNPRGRTGIKGRGLLGRYGPNHATRYVVTRWKRTVSGDIHKIDDKPVLQFVAIYRADSNEWAIPGGMVNLGDQVLETLQREIGEEILSMDGVDEVDRSNIESLFKLGGLELFRGYCDDQRNTDNAWIETVAFNFHDEVGDAFNNIKFSLQVGEVRKVTWMDVILKPELFASHWDYLERAAKMHDAYF